MTDRKKAALVISASAILIAIIATLWAAGVSVSFEPASGTIPMATTCEPSVGEFVLEQLEDRPASECRYSSVGDWVRIDVVANVCANDVGSAWSALGGGVNETVLLMSDARYGSAAGGGWFEHYYMRHDLGIVEIYADSAGGGVAADFFDSAERRVISEGSGCPEERSGAARRLARSPNKR